MAQSTYRQYRTRRNQPPVSDGSTPTRLAVEKDGGESQTCHTSKNGSGGRSTTHEPLKSLVGTGFREAVSKNLLSTAPLIFGEWLWWLIYDMLIHGIVGGSGFQSDRQWESTEPGPFDSV